MNAIDISSVDLNILKIFEALYEEGSATRAGVRLGLTQSAVSAALTRLRKLYDDQLFTRTGRGLIPTLRAQELKPLISDGLNKCRQSLAMGGKDDDGYEGRSIVVGMSDDFEIAFGRSLMGAIAVRAPGLRLVFKQTHSLLVGEMLQGRLIDLALVSGGLTSRLLGREAVGKGHYACLTDPTNAPATKGLTLNEYVRRGHLLISAGGFIGVVDEALAALGHQRRVIASTTHFSALPYLLRDSDAIATLPHHAAAALAACTDLQMFPCPLALPRYSVEVGWRTDSLRDAAVAKVRGVLLEILQIVPWG